jgi:hemerythrin superfamily protein
MKKTKNSKAGGSRKSDGNGNGRSKNGSSKAEETGKIDAIDFLKSQHREVEGLFSKFEKADSGRAQLELATTICEKLTVHATIEEELFYPAVRKGETKDLVLEAAEEHLSVKRIIADIQELRSGDERLEPKVTVLKEQVSHHVKEEENELFPKSKKAISKEERQSLGQQLRDRAAELAGESDESSERPGWTDGTDKREQRSGGARPAMR